MRTRGARRWPAGLAAVAAALAGFLGLIAAPAAAQVPPDADWRRIDTEHFVVVYPDGLEPVARRAAARAEWMHGRLESEFVRAPRGRIHLVVADNFDFAQGLAGVFPWNRVVLYVAPAITNPELEFTDDWLAMGLAHELTHVFHLDYAGGLWAASRAVFGRSLMGFPALFHPRWVQEGVATYYESSLTGAGRVNGSYHGMLLRSGALDGSLRPIDDANGLSPWWPAGRTPYAYGSRFLEWHAGSEGGRALGAFVREAAGNTWGLGLDGDARKTFGHGFKAAYPEWAAELRADARETVQAVTGRAANGAASAGAAVELAGPAYSIAGPRFDPSGARIAFEYFDGKGDRVTRVLPLAGGDAVEQRRNSPGAHAWSPDGRTLYYDQLELVDRYTIAGDLYALDVERGRERRLTRGARLSMADLAPDGRRWVAVQTVPGTNRLVRLDTEDGEPAVVPLTEARPDVHWADPAWSPDGRAIAAARWTAGGFLDLVLLSEDGEMLRELTHDRAVDASAAWSPDGRYLLWASDRGGVRNLWAYDLEAPEGELATYRVTGESGGAFDPEISPDGERLAYVAHTGRGFVLRVVPFDPAAWVPESLAPGPPDSVPDRYGDGAGGPARAYSPWPSLLPTFWLPTWTGSNAEQGAFLGVLTLGVDVVGRHAYGVVAALATETADVEAAAAYTYSGLGNPDLGLEGEQDWELLFPIADSAGTTHVLRRERRAALSARWVWPRFRHVESLTAGLEIRRRALTPADPRFDLPAVLRPHLTEYGADLQFRHSTARAYPFSISPERGWRAALRARAFRVAEDPHLWFASLRARLRAYVPIHAFGFARHALAVQLAGAASIYDGRPELFALGGIPGDSEPLLPGLSLGDVDSDHPVRGFAEGVAVGDRVAAASLEYRFPIALVSRGLGLTPIYVDRLSGGLFLDAGAAWAPGTGSRRELAAAGVEASLDLIFSHSVLYRLRGGLARRLHARPGTRLGWEVYAAVGIGF